MFQHTSPTDPTNNTMPASSANLRRAGATAVSCDWTRTRQVKRIPIPAVLRWRDQGAVNPAGCYRRCNVSFAESHCRR
jgi:hypothetical protein